MGLLDLMVIGSLLIFTGIHLYIKHKKSKPKLKNAIYDKGYNYASIKLVNGEEINIINIKVEYNRTKDDFLRGVIDAHRNYQYGQMMTHVR